MADRRRLTIRLRKCDVRHADEIKARVEELVRCAVTGAAWSHDTSRWIRDLDIELYEKIANVGLLPKRLRPDQITLETFVDDYIASRGDVKPATATVYGHTRRCLVEKFGTKRLLADITAGDAAAWRRWLRAPKDAADPADGGQGLALNTANRRCGIAKQFFADAVERRLILENRLAR